MNMLSMTCSTCGAGLIGLPCPDRRGGCTVAHYGCPVCRAVPCDVCGEKRQPEASYGLCATCVKGAIVWAAKEARREKATTNEAKMCDVCRSSYRRGDIHICAGSGPAESRG